MRNDDLPEVTFYNSPRDLYDAATQIAVSSAEREEYASALQTKISGMSDMSDGNRGTASKLIKLILAGKKDTNIRVMLSTNVPLNIYLRKMRGNETIEGTKEFDKNTFNFYGILKHDILCPMLLSTAPIWNNKIGNPGTLRCAIEGVLNGAHTRKKGMEAYINDYMNDPTRCGKVRESAYTSGGTQSSSSMHALAAAGLCLIPRQGDYRVPESAISTYRFLYGVTD